MAVKVLIKRKVPANKVREMIPLFKQMRVMANEQSGYISGETLKRLDSRDDFLVISMWQSAEDWEKWRNSPERKSVQEKIDTLLGGKTEYEIYFYGIKE